MLFTAAPSEDLSLGGREGSTLDGRFSTIVAGVFNMCHSGVERVPMHGDTFASADDFKRAMNDYAHSVGFHFSVACSKQNKRMRLMCSRGG